MLAIAQWLTEDREREREDIERERDDREERDKESPPGVGILVFTRGLSSFCD